MNTYMEIAIGVSYVGGLLFAFYISNLLLNKICNKIENTKNKKLIKIIGVLSAIFVAVPLYFLPQSWAAF